MKAIKTFVSGLLLSALLLLPTTVRTAELQTFFALKTSSVNTLTGIAEKIAGMAGQADNFEFKEVLKNIKDVKGIDLNSIIGVAAAVNSNGEICPILLLPVTDLGKVDVPSVPGLLDPIQPFLVKKGAGRTNINTPMGTYVALQKQGYLVVAPEDTIDQLPADARKLFADLEKYTFGMKLDCEKVEFETLEANLFGPMIFMMMMQNPEAGEQLEGMIEIYRELFKEFSVMSGGITFNPQTADVEISGTVVPRKGSNYAKLLAGYKQQPTMFGGFRGTPGNVILSFGDSATMPPMPNQNAFLEPSMKQYETIIEGILEQIEMDDDTGEISKAAKEVIASVRKIIETEMKRGSSDYAFSFNTDGTLLLAFDTASFAEIRKLAAMAVGFAVQKVAPGAADFRTDVKASLQQDYVTIEGFKVSSFKVPMDKVAPLAHDPKAEEVLKGLSPGVFWAVKEAGGKQAIAVAVGLDFAKAEQTFKSALEKTKTSAPVQKPVGMFSVQGLGKFLQQAVYPVAEKAGAPDLADAKKAFDILASAGADAAVTLNADIKSDRMEGGYRISGKAIQALVVVIKIAADR